MHLLERFIDEHPHLNQQSCEVIAKVIKETNAAIAMEWKWNTLCFSINSKVFAYFGIEKKKLKLGFWGKDDISSPLIYRDLKLIGYYLVEDLNEELLKDIAFTSEEVIRARLKGS